MAHLPPVLEIDDETVLYYGGSSPLGESPASVVYPCLMQKTVKDVVSIEDVAVKCTASHIANKQEVLINEVRIWKSLSDHSNVLKLLASHVVEPTSEKDALKCYLVTPRMKTDLNCLIFEDPAFAASCTYASIMNLLIQVCKGIKHVHDHGIIHFDIRPWNFMVSSEKHVVLKNFHVSEAVAGSGHAVAGFRRMTQGYMAPEYLAFPFTGDFIKYSKAMDIYSLGVLMWEVLNRTRVHVPPKAVDKSGRSINWPSLHISQNVWCGGPQVLSDLVESCLRYDRKVFSPSDHGRPTINTVLDTLESLLAKDWLGDPVPSYHQDKVAAAKKSVRAINPMENIQPFRLNLDSGGTVKYTGEARIGSTKNTVVLPGTIILFSGEEKDVAIKYAWTGDKEEAEQLKSEIEVLTGLPDHDNVIHLYGGRVIPPDESEYNYKVYVVMELMKCNLERHVLMEADFKTKCTFKGLLRIFMSLCDGLQFLHDHNVIHHDLKLQNILVSSDGMVKIADFGLSKNVIGDQHSVTASYRGTPAYMAPEVVGASHCRDSSFRVSFAIDVYSLGVIFWECLNFCRVSRITYEMEEVQQQIAWPTIMGNESMPCGGPSCLSQLIEDCLKFEGFRAESTQGRPTAQEISIRLRSMLNEDWVESTVFGYSEE